MSTNPPLTKSQRKRLTNLYKLIDTTPIHPSTATPSNPHPTILNSSLYNGELPFEIPLSYLTPNQSVDLFQEEYINLLYDSFDLYYPLPEFLAQLEEDIQIQIKTKELRKLKRKFTPFEKYLNYLQSDQYLRHKRMRLLHTFRRILTAKTGINYNVTHYFPTAKIMPDWFPGWLARKEKMKRIDEKVIKLMQEEMYEELLKEEAEKDKEENKENNKSEIQSKPAKSEEDNSEIIIKSIINTLPKVEKEIKLEEKAKMNTDASLIDTELQIQEQFAQLQALFDS